MIQKLIQFLQENPDYLRWNSKILSSKLGCNINELKEARAVVREKRIQERRKTGNRNIDSNDGKDDSQNDNRDYDEEYSKSETPKLDEYLKEAGIEQENVKSIKAWQNSHGDIRYSVVTSNLQEENLPDIKTIVSLLSQEPNFIPLKKLFPKGEIPIGDKILMVFLADKHIGADVSNLAIFENIYSLQILEDRLEKVKKEIIRAHLNMGGFKEIYLIDLGDALDGMNGRTTRGEHLLPQNLDSKGAFEGFISIHKNFYESIITSGIAQKYHIIHLTNSNHGGDFEYFATRCLEEYMVLKYDSQVEFSTCSKFITHFKIGNHTYLFSHGKDMDDMKSGLPLNLDKKTEQYIIDYLLLHQIPLSNVHFIKGDLHSSNTNWGKHFRYRNIASVFGSSKWMMANFGFNRPGCGFDVIDGDTIYQWDMNL